MAYIKLAYSLRETTFCNLRHTDRIGLVLVQISPHNGSLLYVSRVDDIPVYLSTLLKVLRISLVM